MNEKDKFLDLKKVELQVLNEHQISVRKYHFFFNANEGTDYKLIVGEYTYTITKDGEILEVNNQPFIKNKNFTPYD